MQLGRDPGDKRMKRPVPDRDASNGHHIVLDGALSAFVGLLLNAKGPAFAGPFGFGLTGCGSRI